MATLTTNNIKPVGELDPLTLQQVQDADSFLVWDESDQKHKKMRWDALNANLSNAVQAAQDSSDTAGAAARAAGDNKTAAEGFKNSSEAFSKVSEGWAKGTENGTAVETTSPYHNNNSKFFKDESEAQALKSEGFAVGEQNGTPVQSGTYFENNAKHYKEEADEDAEKAEGFAVGQKDGVDVPSSSPYHDNNAKYYKGESQAQALKSEGFAVGEQNGTPVQSGTYYQNNAKYWAEQAHQATLYTPPLAMSSTTITGAPALSTNLALAFFFTSAIAGSDGTTALSISYNGTSIPVKAHKNGSLINVLAKQIASNTWRYLDAYTTLQAIYDGTNFVIVGNPVVLSGSNYTYCADGSSVVDSVSNGNMNAVTSNAVYAELLNKSDLKIPFVTIENTSILTALSSYVTKISDVKSIQISATNCTDSPDNLPNSNFVYQITSFNAGGFYSIIACDVLSNDVYKIICINNNWSSWQRMLSSSDKIDAVTNNDLRCVTSNAVWNMNNLSYKTINAGSNGDILALIAANATPNKTSILRINGETTCINRPGNEQFNDYFYVVNSMDNNNYVVVRAFYAYTGTSIYTVNRMNGVWQQWKLISPRYAQTINFTPVTPPGYTINVTLNDCRITRVDNTLIITTSFQMSGTFTGTTGWFKFISDSDLNQLIDTNAEYIGDEDVPWVICVPQNGQTYPVQIHKGCQIYLVNGETKTYTPGYQVVLPIHSR